MDVAPWIAHWILMVSDGIRWYCMVFDGILLLNSIHWYSMVLHGIRWYCRLLHGIHWYFTLINLKLPQFSSSYSLVRLVWQNTEELISRPFAGVYKIRLLLRDRMRTKNFRN